ncbi:protein FAM50A isoform X3 [Aotus nancymaae]|uniref:protein FAM50A isoform X3 n=1 Tax=Aotus nancymaae TaxID=37293 RepID=UPI0006261D6A|nr:protein FAM50A isoform X4 [Aotus nancymaae]
MKRSWKGKRSPRRRENWGRTQMWTQAFCLIETVRRRRIGFGKSCGRSGKPSRRRSRARRSRSPSATGTALGTGGQSRALLQASAFPSQLLDSRMQMRKGNTMQQFLQKALEILRKDFSELRSAGVEQLMYIKEDLIIPHHHSFYDFIVTKARGKSGPLFSFDVHDDVRLLSDATVEKDEPLGALRPREEVGEVHDPLSVWEATWPQLFSSLRVPRDVPGPQAPAPLLPCQARWEEDGSCPCPAPGTSVTALFFYNKEVHTSELEHLQCEKPHFVSNRLCPIKFTCHSDRLKVCDSV